MKAYDIRATSKLKHITQLGHSSKGCSKNEVLLERCEIQHGDELPERISDNHVLWHWKTPFNGEYESRRGRFVRCVKTAGSNSVTPIGVIPTLQSHSSAELLICTLGVDFVRNLLVESDRPPADCPIFRPNFQDASVQQLLSLLMKEVQDGNPCGQIYVESLTHALAIRYLFLGGKEEESPEIRSNNSALPSHVLKRVLEYIRNNAESELSLISLAKEAGYSRGHFLKMFHKTTGMTPHRYILNVRIDRAKELLKNTEMGLIDVAALCGFSNHAHLTQVFRRFTSVTPSDYRRNS